MPRDFQPWIRLITLEDLLEIPQMAEILAEREQLRDLAQSVIEELGGHAHSPHVYLVRQARGALGLPLEEDELA